MFGGFPKPSGEIIELYFHLAIFIKISLLIL